MTPEKVFAAHWKKLGPQKLDASRGEASNQHYFAGPYFVKQLEKADDLYDGEGVARLKTVCTAVAELGAAGLPVEKLVLTDKKAVLVKDGKSVFRVYQRLRARRFRGTTSEVQAAARAAGQLHKKGLKALSSKTAKAVAKLEFPYAFEKTVRKLDAVEAYANKKQSLKELARDFPLIRAASAVMGDLEKRPDVLVHLDLHPGNVLFEGDKAVLIDLDNLMAASPLKCAAFSVLRFAPKGRLAQTMAVWGEAYEKESGIALGPGLYKWMAFVELEKILRIVERARKTGSYEKFLPNIAARHLPNLKLVMGAA